MEVDRVAADRDFLTWCLRQPQVPHHKLAALCPDFLVISPPKTGSTWLADNLRCHPQVFVPSIKECRYFSSFFKWLDLGWYLNFFSPAADRLKGEASPSYALLPVSRIRLIRRLLPRVKLIFLMRDPLARAWSHAKHNFRYRESSFAGCGTDLESVSDSQWRENFSDDWPLASGDYLGQLRRWLSVFPREQMYVGFHESIASCPETLLREVFAFLGVNSEVDLSCFPVAERVLSGLPGKLAPRLKQSLQPILHKRTVQLASFLREQFQLDPPSEWEIPQGDGPPSVLAEPFRREFDDDYLARVLEREETFPAAPRAVLDEFRGYNIVFHRRRLVAVEQTLDPACLDHWSAGEVHRYREAGKLFFAPSLVEVKEWIERMDFDRSQAAQRALSAELREAREQIAALEHALRRRPWYVSAARVVRNAWRRFRSNQPAASSSCISGVRPVSVSSVGSNT